MQDLDQSANESKMRYESVAKQVALLEQFKFQAAQNPPVMAD